MKKLLGLNLTELGEVAAAVGLRSFAARQMAKWLYDKRVTDIEQMTDLPKRARAELSEQGYSVGRQAPIAEAVSRDGTAKYLFDGRGGRSIEAVYIPDRERATLCRGTDERHMLRPVGIFSPFRGRRPALRARADRFRLLLRGKDRDRTPRHCAHRLSSICL